MNDTKAMLITTKPSPSRVVAIDLVRIFVIAAVIATHIMASGPLYNSQTTGVVWMFSHTSRNVFFLLMGLVLTYNYGPHRPFSWVTFYFKRFPLVALPYIAWTAIYLIQGGALGQGVRSFFIQFGVDLLTGQAKYHLYFLLVTMQLYLLFPLIRYLASTFASRIWWVLGASLVAQLLLTYVINQHIDGGLVLNWWLQNPDRFILSYQFYLVLGILISSNLSQFEQLVIRFYRHVQLSALLVAAGGLVLYFISTAQGTLPESAAAVFQPYLVIETLAFTLLLFGIGFRWSQRGAPHLRLVRLVSENSFGIYLCHVFVLSGLMLFQPSSSDWLTATVSLLLGVPIVYALSFMLTEIARHTRLSLALAGRKMTQQTFKVQYQLLRNNAAQ